jgi:hypothetical protein
MQRRGVDGRDKPGHDGDGDWIDTVRSSKYDFATIGRFALKT